jgi:hypothetical protein
VSRRLIASHIRHEAEHRCDMAGPNGDCARGALPTPKMEPHPLHDFGEKLCSSKCDGRRQSMLWNPGEP